jgi:hypothetical protein
MLTMACLSRITSIWIITLVFAWFGVCPAQEARRPLVIEGKQVLPLRVLVRPFSNVYKGKDVASGAVVENVPVFQPFYVYARPSAEELEMESGWYEVGSDNRGKVLGWMQAKDVFEWKQTMCLAYTHPEGRKPVLMFERKSALDELIKSAPSDRVKKAQAFYEAIDSQQIPPDFPVESMEPKKAIDIHQQFYLLPILTFETLEIEGREGRLLKLAAAVSGGEDAREGTDIRRNRGFLKEVTAGSTEVPVEVLQKLQVDLVWVVDTTVSMRPYLDKTLEVVKQVSTQLSQNPEVAQAIHFGFWGYRDSVADIPGIGYTTQNYTPQLKPVDQFVNTLATVEVTKIDSVDYPEDVFSGMDDAVRRTEWTPRAMRFIVLVGDAPGHELGHKWNLSMLDDRTLRSMADDASVYVFALHLKEPKAKQFHETAEIQFRSLSLNKGMSGGSAYWSTASNDITGFSLATAEITKTFLDTLKSAKSTVSSQSGLPGTVASSSGSVQPTAGSSGQPKGELESLEPSAGKPASSAGATPPGQQVSPPPEPGQTSVGTLARQMVRAAMVEWIGRQVGAKAPRDTVAWAVDKDLIEPALQSLEVRLLINKRQLDSLKTILGEVMAAGRRGQISAEDFFSALQATAATAARDPNQIKNARTMAQTGLIPEFLQGLPYKSRLMDMSNQLWGSWSVDEQDQFLNEIEARIRAYREIHDTPQGWIALSQGDDPDEQVYPISLDLLP